MFELYLDTIHHSLKPQTYLNWTLSKGGAPSCPIPWISQDAKNISAITWLNINTKVWYIEQELELLIAAIEYIYITIDQSLGDISEARKLSRSIFRFECAKCFDQKLNDPYSCGPAYQL